MSTAPPDAQRDAGTTVSGERRLLDLLELALALPEAERAAWLEGEVPAELRPRLADLLDTEQRMGGFLDQAVALAPHGFPQEGERLGAYRLVEEIDSGGMGVVFRARRDDQAYEQDVAIKLVRPVHLLAPRPVREQLVQRFEAERRLLARLSHPNIARILDGGSTPEGIPWLAMEYVEGETLLAWCRHHAPRTAARVALFAKVCDAVQEAHRHLIVHRDLKPANVLVDGAGEPRLLDFGIARALVGDDADSMTMTSQDAMTPAYASPEQIRRQDLTTSSDVYSLGVMLYELLADVRPYALEGLAPGELERLVCETPVEPLRSALARSGLPAEEQRRRRAALNGDLQRIVARAMHKEPALRYPTAAALADDLRRFLDGRPVQAHPDGFGYRLRRFVRRNRAATAVATLGLAAVLAASVVALWQAREARRNAADLGQVNAFLTEVLRLSDPYAEGMDIPLSQALDESVALIDQQFGNRPDLASGIRFALGYSMLSRYRLEAAEEQLTRALTESEAAFGRADERSLRVLEAIANLRLEQGRKAEAQAVYEDLLARLESGSMAGSSFHRLVLNNLAMLHLTGERYGEAARTMEAALDPQRFAEPMPPEEEAVLLANAAQAAHGLEDMAHADLLYGQAQALLEARYPDGHPDLAILLNNRALLAEDGGAHQAALELHLRSLAMRRRAFGDQHPMVVAALANASRQSMLVGDAAQALALASEGVALAATIYQQPSDLHARILALHAEALVAAGRRVEAGAALQQAERIAREVEAPISATTDALERARLALRATR